MASRKKPREPSTGGNALQEEHSLAECALPSARSNRFIRWIPGQSHNRQMLKIMNTTPIEKPSTEFPWEWRRGYTEVRAGRMCLDDPPACRPYLFGAMPDEKIRVMTGTGDSPGHFAKSAGGIRSYDGIGP
jgi:hypothetical protein